MAKKRLFRVIDTDVQIREQPSTGANATGKRLKYGDKIQVIEDPVFDNGYEWVKHEKGWSAVGKQDRSLMFMVDETNRNPDDPYYFKVWSGTLSVRDKPGFAGKRISLKLKRGQVIEVKPDSVLSDGLIWWQHKDGWSAERSTNGYQIYLKEVLETPASVAVPQAKKVKISDTWKGKMILQAADHGVKARAKPTIDSRTQINRYLRRGQALQCNMDSIIEADNYYWVKHQHGWSAIMDVMGREKFLGEPGTIPGVPRVDKSGRPVKDDLPMLGKLVEKFPLPITNQMTIQYYGNNVFAIEYGQKWYKQTQGMHTGIDFNVKGNEQIKAGVHAVYEKIEKTTPGNTKVILRGTDDARDYRFIYQHVFPYGRFNKGDVITPDTVIATVDPQTNTPYNPHLHFEIRYIYPWVVNPLWFFTPELQQKILTAKPGDKPNNGYWSVKTKYIFFYYNPGVWEKWITPEDQPMIELGGDRTGPLAKYKYDEL